MPALRPFTAPALLIAATLALAGCATPPAAPPTAAAAATPAAPAGEVKGSAARHDAASRAALVAQAQVALPAGVAGATPWFGRWSALPADLRGTVPVVLFLHGSSGLGLKAIEEWQRWLAERGVASVAPDSFALPERLTYKSPVGKDVYERIHALRASEIEPMQAALAQARWADPQRLLLAGTSEGAVPVARHDGAGFAGRMLFAWSCEDNYFVQAHRTAAAPEKPVLNVISSTDPFFSPGNTWVGNPNVRGHCGAAFAAHKAATVVLIAGAPHTLLNLPAARHAVDGFLKDTVRR
jgi:dienelactone hydrolase